MLKQLFDLFVEKLNDNYKKNSTIEYKIVEIIEEIDELEIEHAQALADAERWGDLDDNSHWRTVEVNRIKRVIEAKKRMIDTLNTF